MPRRLVVARWISLAMLGVAGAVSPAAAADESAGRDFSGLPDNTWVKLSPLKDTPVSPRLGYEGACVWDSSRQVMIRYGGHNQGGGGEQGSEIWLFDPRTARWTLKEPNTSPPGICCGQQNVFDPVSRRYVRFPAFSASHGWQWWREVYLNDSSLWTYDPATNLCGNMGPLPAATPRPLRSASWDAEHQVIVMFGGEGSHEGTWVYNPWENTWTAMHPKIEPADRSGGNMAYDARHKVHVLFGAQFIDDPHTWAYDLGTNQSRDMQPPSMPSTDKNDAVLTYDAKAGLVMAIVKITTGKDEEAQHRLETWAYDYGQNHWTKMNPEREPDATSNRARQLMYAPELGVALLENRPSNSSGLAEQQVWAYRLPASASREVGQDAGPRPPAEVTVSTGSERAVLSWRPGVDSGADAQAVYRGTGEQPWQIDYRKVATVDARATRYEDRDLARGRVYSYFVRAVDKSGREGPASQKASTRPRVVEDVLVSVVAADRVELTWPVTAGDEIVGFHVERAGVEVLSEDQLTRLKAQTPALEQPSVGVIRRVGSFQQITASPVAGTSHVDARIDLRKPAAVEGEPVFERNYHAEQLDTSGRMYRYGVYAYRVRAVNSLGILGGPSAAVLTIPSAPQFVFAKEDGTTCHLRWQRNSEQGTRGYRVYRMDGRYGKDPIARLTPEPMTAVTFSDSAAGKPARRYHVVAVDALGQEGLPSSPAWFNREWQPFYLPFVGEWHQ